LKINSVISVVTAFIILLILSLALYRLNNANGKGKIAGEIITSALERVALKNDYISNSNERAKEQWFAKHEEIGRLLKSASERFLEPEDIKALAEMLKDNESIGKIFSGIVKNREKAGSHAYSADLSRVIETRLLSRLNMRVYEFVTDGRQLLEASRRARDSAFRLAGAGIIIVFVILTATTVINSWIMGRTITDRIRRLRDGAMVIGGGNLDHKIDVKGDDEFAELSDAFDVMTAKLRGLYSDLENEIKERKNVEKAIVALNRDIAARNSELVAANRELEGFSYSVSHDLRAPLRHMSGFVKLLEQRLGDYTDVQISHYMEAISGASKKMGTLIDDLLAFSRIARVEMRKGKISFNTLVKAVVGDIQHETKGRDIIWDIDALPDVYGDQSMLSLVLANLISNAVKYTSIRPRAEIRIGYKEDQEEFIFFVKDNGAGFDMKYANKLFGVFQRLHTQTEFEGTGIGLANVQRIIARHGGRVWAEAAVGQGAAFYFTLPKIKET